MSRILKEIKIFSVQLRYYKKIVGKNIYVAFSGKKDAH